MAKPKNEDHVSCLADSHLTWEGGGGLGIHLGLRAYIERKNSEFFQVPRPLYREEAIYRLDFSKSQRLYNELEPLQEESSEYF